MVGSTGPPGSGSQRPLPPPNEQFESLPLHTAIASLEASILPFLPLPPTAAWRYLQTSAGPNTVYFVLIAEACARGGVALAYPLMRGAAPMLTALAAWVLVGEVLPLLAWLGIAAIGTAAQRPARADHGTASAG